MRDALHKALSMRDISAYCEDPIALINELTSTTMQSIQLNVIIKLGNLLI